MDQGPGNMCLDYGGDPDH